MKTLKQETFAYTLTELSDDELQKIEGGSYRHRHRTWVWYQSNDIYQYNFTAQAGGLNSNVSVQNAAALNL